MYGFCCLQQIKTVLVEFKKFLEEFGGWAKELIKLLDESGVGISRITLPVSGENETYSLCKQKK